MTEEISKQPEGSPVELGKEELETVAGGLVGVGKTTYTVICTICHWQASFTTSMDARAAGAEHIQNYRDHIVKILAYIGE